MLAIFNNKHCFTFRFQRMLQCSVSHCISSWNSIKSHCSVMPKKKKKTYNPLAWKLRSCCCSNCFSYKLNVGAFHKRILYVWFTFYSKFTPNSMYTVKVNETVWFAARVSKRIYFNCYCPIGMGDMQWERIGYER